MKNRIITRLAALFIALASAGASVSAYDFGLTVTNDTDFIFERDWALTQTDEARVWFSVPFSPTAALYVSALYEYTGTFVPNGSSMIPWRFDLGRTEFEGLVENAFGPTTVFRYSVGRIACEDFSGRVMSNLTDGFRTELALDNLVFTLGAGYRGLTYKDEARSLIDDDDKAAYKKSNPPFDFAPKRVLANLGFRANEVFSAQDLGLEAWGQMDLESSGTATHTAYVEPYFEGRFGRALRWRGWAALELGYDFEFFKAMAAGATVRYSAPEIANLRVTGNVAWASGANTTFRTFSPIRQKQIVPVAEFPFADVLLGSLDVSVSPLRALTVGFTSSILCRSSMNDPSDDALTVATVRSDATGSILGYEEDIRFALRVSSDLTFNLSGGVFIPNTVDMYNADSPLRWKSSLNAVFNL